jgi:hypothetical protein
VKRERQIAEEIANELHRVFGPIMPEALAEKNDAICKIFADAFDRYHVVSEASGARILAYVPKVLADLNLKFAELDRQLDAAVRPPARLATIGANGRDFFKIKSKGETQNDTL